MLKFDQEVLERELGGIKPHARTIFALACAERLLPLYEVYCYAISTTDRWVYLRTISDNLWDQLSRGIVVCEAEFLAGYPALAPGDDTPRAERTLLDPLAENAVLALGSAWECHLSGEIADAFLAAEQAYEAMDYTAQHIEGIDYGESGGEAALLRSSFVQGELKRQLDDLKQLEHSCESDAGFHVLAKLLREKAATEGKKLRIAIEKFFTGS